MHTTLTTLVRHVAMQVSGQRNAAKTIARANSFVAFLFSAFQITHASQIAPKHLDAWRLALENRSLSASTINNYLSAVSLVLKVGDRADLKLPFKSVPSKRQWHATDDDLAAINKYLAMRYGGGTEKASMADDYIEFVCETGFRVEEVLRLLPSDFTNLNADNPGCNVPGTKTEGAAVWVPISQGAAAIARRRIGTIEGRFAGSHTIPERRLFDISYRLLQETWQGCRKAIGAEDNPTATLKGLRRTFAARALRKGLSKEIIQELMRHASLSTTLGYLKLFGMSDNPETRKLLNRQLGPTKWTALEFGVGDFVSSTPPPRPPKVPRFSSGAGVFQSDFSELERRFAAQLGKSEDDFPAFFEAMTGSKLHPFQRDIAKALGLPMGDDADAPPSLPPEALALLNLLMEVEVVTRQTKRR